MDGWMDGWMVVVVVVATTVLRYYCNICLEGMKNITRYFT
jgi:hypothetical protein